jgi:hypothetical protein
MYRNTDKYAATAATPRALNFLLAILDSTRAWPRGLLGCLRPRGSHTLPPLGGEVGNPNRLGAWGGGVWGARTTARATRLGRHESAPDEH